MSAAASLDLEQLKQQAEAQMRRAAPPLEGNDAKRRKVDDQSGDETVVGRFEYAADQQIAAGSTCLLASCGFNRQRSAAKELLTIVKPLLREGTQLQLVKVCCRGLAVVRVEPAAGSAAVNVTELVEQILQQIESGKLKPTRFCERITPGETTCMMTAADLEAALTRVVTQYVARLQCSPAGSDSQQQQQQQQPVEYAVLFKSRGIDKQVLAELQQASGTQGCAEQQQGLQPPSEARDGTTPLHQEQEQVQVQVQAGDATADAANPTAVGKAAVDSTECDRVKVVNMAAAVMQQCCKAIGGAKVNLSKPQVAIMVETIPLLRQQVGCVVTVLPRSILSSGHNIKIKPTSAVKAAGKPGKRAK